MARPSPGKKRGAGRTRKMPSSLRLVLITGVPATGKTTLGEFLHDEEGYKHLDFEHLPTLIRYVPDGLTLDKARIDEVRYSGTDTVITWGFVPDTQLASVLELRELGFRWVWLDGDRETALRHYLTAGRPRDAWDRQLALIHSHIDPMRTSLAPIVVDPFDGSGHHRPNADVARDILA